MSRYPPNPNSNRASLLCPFAYLTHRGAEPCVVRALLDLQHPVPELGLLLAPVKQVHRPAAVASAVLSGPHRGPAAARRCHIGGKEKKQQRRRLPRPSSGPRCGLRAALLSSSPRSGARPLARRAAAPPSAAEAAAEQRQARGSPGNRFKRAPARAHVTSAARRSRGEGGAQRALRRARTRARRLPRKLRSWTPDQGRRPGLWRRRKKGRPPRRGGGANPAGRAGGAGLQRPPPRARPSRPREVAREARFLAGACALEGRLKA